MQYLGYIFLFYVGFYFFRLAENHKKNKWLFGILGVIFFITVYFSYLLYNRFFNTVEFNLENLSAIGIKGFFISSFFSIILFQILNFLWNKKEKNKIDEIGES